MARTPHGRHFERTSSRPRKDRGAVAVEAALVTPLLVTVLIGILEMSLLMRDSVSVTSAVRAGARIASAQAGAGPVTCPSSLSPAPCPAVAPPLFAQAAADAVQKAGTAMPANSITSIVVYDANTTGYPLPEGNSSLTCTTNCVIFTWDAALQRFRYNSGSWASTSVNACVNSAAQDSIGVAVTARHSFVTGLFGSGMNITQRNVLRFEPLAAEQCLPNTHP